MLQRIGIVLLLLLLAGCQSGNKQHEYLSTNGTYWLREVPAQATDSRVRFLVLHYTAEDFPDSLHTLTGKSVSAHYLVPEQLEQRNHKPIIWQPVPESERAWHAGNSYWRGSRGLNDSSVGIEIVNQGYHDSPYGKRWYAYPSTQIDAVILLSQDIIRRNHISPRNVVAHSDIAPQRKQDPGPAFPWQRLAEQGIGAWPNKTDVGYYLAGRKPNAPVDLRAFQQKLARWGYDITADGVDDQRSRQVISAFQMHYRPANFSGIADAQSEAILDALLKKYPD